MERTTSPFQNIKILVNIIQFIPLTDLLKKIPFVSTAFSAALLHPNAVVTLRFSCFPSFQVNDAFISRLLPEIPGYPQKLDFSYCPRISDKSVESTLAKFPQVYSINLEGNVSNLSNLALESIARHCKDLRELNIGGCLRISLTGLADLAKSCTSISNLALKGIGCVDEAVITLICSKFSLTALNLNGCCALSDVSLGIIASKLAHCLEELDIGYCDELTDFGISKLAACAELRKLSLYGLRKLSSHGLSLCLKGMSHIECLDLSSCIALDDNAFRTLGDSVKIHTLRLYNVPQITGVTLAILASRLQGLRELSLYGLSTLTPKP